MHLAHRALAVLVACLPVSAEALTTRHLASDEEMLDLMVEPHFVAGGQIGNSGPRGIHEILIGRNPVSPIQIADYQWPNGTEVPLSLEYDGEGLVTFRVGGTRLDYSPARGFEDVFVRTRSEHDATAVRVDGLVLDGEPVADPVRAEGGDGLDILWIQGGQLADGFVLEGRVTFEWPGIASTNYATAFQIRVGTVSVTTAVRPGSWSAIKGHFRD